MSKYHNSLSKYLFDTLVLIVVIALILPLFVTISIVVFFANGSPVFFIQRRMGKKGRVFKIIKFRTMVNNASQIQKKYKKLNEADGPTFKIGRDPRFTKIGYLLSRIGLDELPQFVNILNGDMSLVGPRPLPVNEARQLTKTQKIRELVKPGIVSTWVTNGSHKLKFSEWMRLDKEYVEHGNLLTDLGVIKDSTVLIIKSIINVLR